MNDTRNLPERPHVKRGAKSAERPAAKYLAPPFRRDLAFIASAAMLTVIQPPIGWWPLAWVSLVPFILACSPQVKIKPLMVTAYVVSLGYWLGNLYWVFPITIVGWAVFCLYTALLWPIAAIALRFCRAKKIPLFLAVPIVFVAIERLQGFFLGGFFWRFLAHSQYNNITLIQIADIFGAAGISFLIAMVNGLIAELIVTLGLKSQDPGLRLISSQKIAIFLKAAIVCSILIITVIYGRWRINESEKFVTDGPLVGSLQSNVPQSVKRTFESSDVLFNELMEKSKAAAASGAELIVWPETMVQATLNPDVLGLLEPNHPWNVFDQALRDHARNTAYLLVGAYGGKPQIKDETTIHLVETYNSAFLYQPDGRKASECYNKIHLVPFGEVLPFRKTVPWLYNFLMKFTPYNYDYSLDYGSDYTVFEMTGKPAQNYKFSVMICYEDTVPDIARRFALNQLGRKQINWLVNISNDGWFVRFRNENVTPSAELPQHAAVCVFRAVENRLPVLRSVNTGISCLIDSLGRIHNSYIAANPEFPRDAMQRKGMAGWFVDRMPIDTRVTFFSRHGQWLDSCCTACFVVLVIISVINRPKPADDIKAKCQRRRIGFFALFLLCVAVVTMVTSGCDGTLNQPGNSRLPASVKGVFLKAIQIIQNGLTDDDPRIRANSVEVIAATGQTALMPQVQPLLADAVVPVRFLAAISVGDLKYSAAQGQVQQLLYDQDENVRIAAAYALTMLGNSSYLKIFREALTSKDQTVRANAALLLGKSGDRSKLTQQALWWALRDKDSGDNVRFQAAEALAMLGDQDIYTRLWSMLISVYADDRVMGIRAMGALGTEQAKEVLSTMLDDSVLEVRLAAAEQLGRLKDSSGQTQVLEVLTGKLTAELDQQSQQRVRLLSALAIGQIGTEYLAKFLPELLADESKFVRIAAAKAVFQYTMRK